MTLEPNFLHLSATDQKCMNAIIQIFFTKNLATYSFEEISEAFYQTKFRSFISRIEDKVDIKVSADDLEAEAYRSSDFPMPLLRRSLNTLVDEGYLLKRLDLKTSHFEISPDFANQAFSIHTANSNFSDPEENSKITKFVPAANRFVSIDHNGPEVMTAKITLKELEERVLESNSLEADKNQRLAIINEVKGIRELLDGPVARIASVWNATRNSGVLAWLAEHGADAVLNAIAVEAIRQLLNIFGIG